MLLTAATSKTDHGARPLLADAWPAWSVVASFAWLLPTHTAPWPTAYAEFWIAAALLPIALRALLLGNSRWAIDRFSAGFVVAALVPLLQAGTPLFNFAGEAPLASFYLIGFALASALGRRAEETGPGHLIDGLFASLAIAAIVSTGLAIAQWLSVDTLGDFLAPMPPHDRPVANVGQPNNLATLLVWGLVGLWRAHVKRQIGPLGALLGAAFVLFGVALTQSRAGVLQVVLLAVLAATCRRKLGTGHQSAAWVGLALWFLACSLGLDSMTRAWTEQFARPLLDTASPRERTMLLRMVLSAIGEHPWVGYGWNQNVVAHVALAEQFPMHGTVGNAHNLVLDLIVWNGLPLGALMTFGIGFWLWRTVRRCADADSLLVAAALGTFGLHAMLELPHVLAYFLVPAAVMAGTLNARTRLPLLWKAPRNAVAIAVAGFSLVLGMMFIDYRRIEVEEMEFAIAAAWPGTPRAEPAPNATVLFALQDGMRALRMDPRAGMDAEALARSRRAVTRYPLPLPLFQYARASALNGRPGDALWALQRLCDLHAVDVCAAADGDWRRLTADGQPSMALVAVPVVRSIVP